MSRHEDRIPIMHMLDYARTAQRLIDGRARADLDSDEMPPLIAELERILDPQGSNVP